MISYEKYGRLCKINHLSDSIGTFQFLCSKHCYAGGLQHHRIEGIPQTSYRKRVFSETATKLRMILVFILMKNSHVFLRTFMLSWIEDCLEILSKSSIRLKS